MEWRDVVDSEGKYLISDAGTVRSLPQRGTQGGVLNPKTGKGGYQWVQIRGRSNKVHHLVLTAFVGPRPPGLDGRHLNGDPADNRLVNLRWGTRSENNLDAVRHGTHFQSSKTHCKQDHPFNEANTITTSKGHRKCRTCKNDEQRRRRARSHT